MTQLVSTPRYKRRTYSPRPAQPRLARWLLTFFWFVFVPAAVASAAGWLLAGPAAANASDPALNTVEAWLRDQVVLVWLATFLVTTALLRYWRFQLPPRGAWSVDDQRGAALSTRELGLYALVVLLGVGAALALRSWVAEPRKVRSASMMPTLYPGDLVLVRKPSPFARKQGAAPPPERGQPILLATPDPALRELEPTLFKRVVGLPGDVLLVDRGTPVINGWRVPRCGLGMVSLQLPSLDAPIGGALILEWLGNASYLTLVEGVSSEPVQGPYTVKPGEVWVLGDNRNNSSDSRTWFGGQGGGVPFEGVLGTPTRTLLNSLGSSKLRLTRLDRPTLPATAQHLSDALARCQAKKPQRTSPPGPLPVKKD